MQSNKLEQTFDPREENMSVSPTEIRISGRTVRVLSAIIDDRTVIAKGTVLKMAAVHDEELREEETIADPERFISQLKEVGLNADIFSFCQNLPSITPKYTYHLEWDNLAVIPIKTFSDWWENRVESSVRRAVKRAAKIGVVVKLVDFDDALVEGIVRLYNETPIRRGKPFWHYQKSFDAVKYENSTYPGRNDFLGAYYNDELIGFIRIIYAGSVAHIVQQLTMTKHYDKRVANALIAKAVEVSEKKGISHLTYCNYVYHDPGSSMTEFKRRNGFEQVFLPRYYIPLTLKGKIALRFRLHRGFVKLIPKPLVIRLLRLRSLWYARRLKAVEESL